MGAKSLITKPTRIDHNTQPSLLDHFYTNNNTLNKIKPMILLTDVSDHFPISIEIYSNKEIIMQPKLLYRNYNNMDIHLFLK